MPLQELKTVPLSMILRRFQNGTSRATLAKDVSKIEHIPMSQAREYIDWVIYHNALADEIN